jgi:23S rRNA G2445 N2-methylase RlmL
MYIAKTLEGLEETAAEELKGKKILQQRIAFTSKKRDPRTINTTYKLITSFTFPSLEKLVTKANALTKTIKKSGSYNIKCSRTGKQNFKSVDVIKEVGTLLREEGYTINYKQYKKTIYIDIINNTCFIGMLIKENLCKRQYRIKHNNKSINACIAAAMIKEAKIKKTETLLDPCCKDAIIPLEAHRLGIKKIYALDPVKNNVRNAMLNCRYAKTKIKPQCYEISWLDTLFKKASIDHVITNLPISKHDKEPEKFMKEFFHQTKFITKKTITIITTKPAIIKENTKLKPIKEINITIGDMKYAILQFNL